MARPRRELAKTHVPQFPAERLLGDLEAKLLEQPPREIDQPPANDAMEAGRGPSSTTCRNTWRWLSSRMLGAPGALPFKRPSGPLALKRTTQSRTICTPTPPVRAASERDPPP